MNDHNAVGEASAAPGPANPCSMNRLAAGVPERVRS